MCQDAGERRGGFFPSRFVLSCRESRARNQLCSARGDEGPQRQVSAAHGSYIYKLKRTNGSSIGRKIVFPQPPPLVPSLVPAAHLVPYIYIRIVLAPPSHALADDESCRRDEASSGANPFNFFTTCDRLRPASVISPP